MQSFDTNTTPQFGSARNVVPIDAVRIRRLVAGLPKRHRLIITWLFGLEGLTLDRREIAARLRIKPSLVCRTELEALRLLHDRALNVPTLRRVA